MTAPMAMRHLYMRCPAYLEEGRTRRGLVVRSSVLCAWCRRRRQRASASMREPKA